ncbi:MAG: hypothetical protein AAFQ45_01575 [Pseudomonadota bacterium]
MRQLRNRSRALGLRAGTLLVAVIAGLFAVTGPTAAGEVDVLDAKAEKTDEGIYRFTVTLKHADTGWDHYADRWDVVAPDGTVLGRRKLFHPHVDEQPFTRSLGNVRIPDGVTEVTIRGHDSVHGLGGKEMTIKLPTEKSS